MKLFFYYATRTFKNQIKKLFKTWVAVLIGCCFLFGLLVGLGAAFLDTLADTQMPDDEPSYEETVPSEEDISAEEEGIVIPPELMGDIAAAAAGALFLILIAFHILSADKSGNKIFPMADVNLLFASPLKPQSVLLFRLTTQLGAAVAAGLYLIFQLPNLVLNLGLPARVAWLIIPVFIFMLAYAKLIQIFFYTLASTKLWVRKLLAPLAWGLLLLTAGGLVLYYRSGTVNPFEAGVAFFAAEAGHLIPIWGWLVGAVAALADGAYLMAAIYTLLLCGGIVGLSFLIWHLRADFYEDALQNSSEMAEAMQTVQNEGGLMARKKKDRSDRYKRDGLSHGTGASVLLTKSLYNRFRFAFLRIFTKTTVTYLCVTLLICILMRTVFEASSLLPVVLTLGGFVFFRSLGNPIANDLSKVSFQMMPESPFAKIGYSLLAGTVDCLLDLLPSLIVACLLLGANPLVALCWLFFILSVDLYSSSVGAFIDLSLPVSLAKTIRGVIQIFFIYFGLLPDIVLLIIGGIFGMLPLFAAFAGLFNLAIGVGFGALCPLFLLRGRR